MLLWIFIFIEAEDMCPWAFPPPPPNHLHSHLAHSRHCYRQVCLQNIISNDSLELLQLCVSLELACTEYLMSSWQPHHSQAGDSISAM